VRCKNKCVCGGRWRAGKVMVMQRHRGDAAAGAVAATNMMCLCARSIKIIYTFVGCERAPL